MLVVYRGKVCWMVWNENKKKWEYIPERKMRYEV